MPRTPPFVWTLAPLLDEARLALEEREDALHAAGREVERRLSALERARTRHHQAIADERDAIKAIVAAMRGRASLAERQDIDRVAVAAKQATNQRALDVESAGEEVRKAELLKTAAQEARDDAEVGVKELFRLRERAEAEHRRNAERDEERRRESEAMDHWRPGGGIGR